MSRKYFNKLKLRYTYIAWYILYCISGFLKYTSIIRQYIKVTLIYLLVHILKINKDYTEPHILRITIKNMVPIYFLILLYIKVTSKYVLVQNLNNL